MFNLKRFFSLSLVLLLGIPALPARASAYDGHPKLVVILVLDQFREDYLERYRGDLKGRGFRLFLDHGAYFADCYYNYANTETAPGHSTLGTGAYSDGHGINSNEWWDLSRNKLREITSVEDERYHLVGLANASTTEAGSSPRNLRASTVGDELRLATEGHSLVYGISLKDRAAILPAGAAANGAFWIDHATGSFITSSFYMNELPKWAVAFNGSDRASQAMQEAGITKPGEFYNQVGKTPAANAYEIDFAKALITNEQLGKHATTDMLTLSLSAPDISGHAYGPDSPEQHVMVDTLDTQLDAFFTWLDKNIDGGLANVWITLSADHGVAPVPAQAATLGMPAATIDMKKLIDNVNDAMNAKFSPGEKVVYIFPKQSLPYLSLNMPSFQVAGINEQEAEAAVQAAVEPAFEAVSPAPSATVTPDPYEPDPGPEPVVSLAAKKKKVTPPALLKSKPKAATAAAEEQTPTPPPVRFAPRPFPMHTYTRLDLASGQLPPSEFGTLMAHSYSPNGGWYVMIIPEAFQMEHYGTGGTNHYTPYSYDRHVPLAFFGAPFTPGIYQGRVEPVDLAATLASLLGINQPSASIGHILTQAIRPLPHPWHPASTTRALLPPTTPQRRVNLESSREQILKTDMRVRFCGLELRNPVIAASGTFGYGIEFDDIINLEKIGGFVTKGLSREPMAGNAAPRIIETSSGMMNAIGLQNIGVAAFITDKLPRLAAYPGTACIANVFGFRIEDYVAVIEALNAASGIAAYELNASCPNTIHGGQVFGADGYQLRQLVTEAKAVAKRPLIVKLTPNVTSIAAMARVAEDAGADALSLVNTFLSLSIDIKTRKPHIANVTGGLSGPAIRPIAVRMVYEAWRTVSIPILGMGGIMRAEDAVEFLLAGATAVQVGTASYADPRATERIAKGLETWCTHQHVAAVTDLTGAIQTSES